MTEVLVRRWRKFGKDFIYVDAADGSPVGSLNRESGAVILVRRDLQDLFESAIAPYAPSPSSAQISDACNADTGSFGDSAASGGWADLSENKPGQEARKQAKAWATGADGEEIVGAYLAQLESVGWRILHAITVGSQGADIDHLVIGPGGVFTVDTKTHPDVKVCAYEHAIFVNGQKKPRYLRKARHEAALAARRLTDACARPVQALPVIAFLCDGLTIKQEPAGVHVVDGPTIAVWLRQTPSVMATADIDAIWDQARRSTTWLPAA